MIKNVGLMFISVLLSCVLGEFAARIAGFDEIHLLSNKMVRLHRFECGHGNTGCDHPMFSEWSKWFSDPDYFKENEVVLIDGKPISKKKPEGQKRVLLIGDSATFGTSVKKEERFSQLLEENLDRDWLVINAGVPGFDNIDELAVFRDKLKQLDPDYLIWQIFLANDLNHNILNSGYRIKEFSYKPELFEKSALLKLIFVGLAQAGIDTEGILKDSPKNEENLYDNTAEDHRGLRFQNYAEGEFALYHKKPSSLEPLVYDTFSFVAMEFKRIAKEIRAKPLVIIVPTRSSIRGDLEILPDLPHAKKKLGKSDSYYKEELDYKRIAKRVRLVLEETGLPYVDPATSDGIDESFLVDGDDHPSSQGHLFYAEKILEFLKSGP